jgi:hypothetical protein
MKSTGTVTGFPYDFSNTSHPPAYFPRFSPAGCGLYDAHTIRTVTYMQATSFTYLFGIKNKSDEWYPDVKCAISLQNPESPEACRAQNEPTPSTGLLKLSSSCTFNQNKNNTLPGSLGQIIVGALQAGPIGIIQNAISLNSGSPGLPSLSAGADLPTGGALELTYINTCPDDVQSPRVESLLTGNPETLGFVPHLTPENGKSGSKASEALQENRSSNKTNTSQIRGHSRRRQPARPPEY